MCPLEKQEKCIKYIRDHFTDEKTTFVDIDFLNEEGGKVKGKYTEVTAEDHKAYIEDGGDVEDYIYDCETKEFSKNEDGSWKLVLSDYSDEALEGIYDKAGLSLIFDADNFKADVTAARERCKEILQYRK